jgi:uncharacterized protein
MRRYSSVPFADVKITGPFWSERLETVLSCTIPSQHRQLEKFNMLRSLKLPKPVPPLTIPPHANSFTTEIFWDSDIGKWVEAAAYALSHRRDAAIEAQIESIVDDLEKAQAPDGYLNCWYLEREPENRWTNLRDNHELYNAGHLLEGAVAYFRATGRDRMLRVMERYMDHIASVFGRGPGQKRGYCGTLPPTSSTNAARSRITLTLRRRRGANHRANSTKARMSIRNRICPCGSRPR